MEPRDPDYRDKVERIFSAARFIGDLGVRLTDCGPGWCASRVDIEARHLQQDHLVHAGVIITLADHTAGAAAGSLVAPDETVLTAEIKTSLLRGAFADFLVCRAVVLKPGKRLSFVEAEVHANGKLVAKATATMAVVPIPREG